MNQWGHSMDAALNNICLVSTTHREKGSANGSNLYSILLHIKPEVVFIELPSDYYDAYFTICSITSPESDAINRYKKDYPVEIIPVDSVAPDPSLRNEFDFLFDKIADNSQCYDAMAGYIHQFTCQYGYPYLNSEKYHEHWLEKKDEEMKTVTKLDDPKITSLYKLWEDMNEQREYAMIRRIHEYTEQNVFSQAVFLVGSAHSRSIIKKTTSLPGSPHIRPFNIS